MFDPDKVVCGCCNIEVRNLIGLLKGFPDTARVNICGDNQFYIHVEKDGSAICIDTESLDDCYPDGVNPCENL